MNEKVGVLDSHLLGEVLKASARKLGERCGAAAVEMLGRRLAEYIGSVEVDTYSYVWRSAIEEHEQDANKNDTRAVLVDAVRDAALGATNTSSPAALVVAKSLLQSHYPTLTRVGIFVCGEHYGTVGAAFWECVTRSWFIESPYWHELYWFIKKTFSKFSAAERLQFLGFVDQLKGDWSDKSEQEKWDETQKRDLLHPAFGLGDSDVDERYLALVQRLGPVQEHPDFLTYSTNESVGDRSPVASESLIGMSSEELVAFLKGFVPDGQSWDSPTYRGLSSSISEAVRASDDGFAGRMGLFADLARPYQHGLLRGLKERWSDDKRDIDWPATLSLLQAIVSSPAFGSDLAADRAEGWEPSVRWVVIDIADLIKGALGTERHLPSRLYKSCLQVLHLVLDATPREDGQANEAVSHAFNSPRGKALESLMHLALAMRREEVASNLGSGETWVAVGSVLDAELTTSEFGLNSDFATIAGMYCANLHYLSPEWTAANFDRLFSSQSEEAWRCAAQGFAYQQRLYDWLFKRLVAGGHLRKMVYQEDLPDQVAKRALQFLGLAYLEGMENLDGGGLLSELVAELKVKELSLLCWYFWTFRGMAEPSDRTSRILAFWMRVAQQVRASCTEVPELQAALIPLVVFIYDLSPAVVEAMIQAAPHAGIRHNGYMLVESLARFASQYPKEVAEIFRAAMSGFLPDYRQEDVIGLVNRLAEAGKVEDAEWICNVYAERGSTLLKETYHALREGQRLVGNPGQTSA